MRPIWATQVPARIDAALARGEATMIGNGKVFISHSHEDTGRCEPLLAALHAWGVDYWFDTDRMDAGHDLSQRIQQALAARDIFIRVCSGSVQRRPYWVNLETGAFR